MSDLLDIEAEESENEMSGDEDMNASRRKKRQLDSSDEEDDDDDEEKAREEMKDFLNDDDDEDDGDRMRRRRKKKKRRRRSSGSSGSSRSRSRSRSASRRSDDEDLDQDDLDLIEDNLGVKLSGKKKRSRIQMGSSSESSGEDLPDPERHDGRHSAASGMVSDEDELANFIVDEEGKPIERKKKKKTYRFDDSQRQLAEDIFGVAFDYEEFDQLEDRSDISESDDYDDEEYQERRKKGKKKKKTTIFDKFEPYDLAMGHYTDKDQEIRLTDVPERMQLRTVPVTTVSDESDELDREAEWIYKHGFTQPTLTTQKDYERSDCEKWQAQTATVEKIKKVGLCLLTINFTFIDFFTRPWTL